MKLLTTSPSTVNFNKLFLTKYFSKTLPVSVITVYFWSYLVTHIIRHLNILFLVANPVFCYLLGVVKVFRFMTEFRFLEILRGPFSKSRKSVEKTIGGMGYTYLVRRYLIQTQPREMLLQIDTRKPWMQCIKGRR